MLPRMSDAAATDVLGSVTLVTGPEEFLAERAVGAVIAAVAASSPQADFSELDAAELDAGSLAELTSPSLFAAVRTVVVRRLQEASDSTGAALQAYAAAPASDVAMVLVHSGGQKGKALLDALRKTKGVRQQTCETPKPWELPGLVVAQGREHAARIGAEAAAALVDAVGSDLRTLAAAVGQLAADCPGEPITVPVVRRYFGGRAEVKGFAVAEAAIGGDVGNALEQLRWAMNNGVVPVLVTSAFATGLRDLARFSGARQNLRDADLAREMGVAPWKIKILRRQASGWDPEGLAAAITAVAKADEDVKGAAGDADYTLERLVLTVCEARRSSGSRQARTG
jgi:DNA polymerase III subunit delta